MLPYYQAIMKAIRKKRRLPLWQRILRRLLRLPTPPPLILTHLGIPPSQVKSAIEDWETARKIVTQEIPADKAKDKADKQAKTKARRRTNDKPV